MKNNYNFQVLFFIILMIKIALGGIRDIPPLYGEHGGPGNNILYRNPDYGLFFYINLNF